ncbi:MAG: hypothetical protein PHC68_01210 [Syntrophorhabdaceae bacterium]|nr:hypothetical protein [Syntrophorhabdaceae bacterium]
MLTPQVFFSTGRTLLRGASFIRQVLQGRLYPEPIPHEALRKVLREARAAIDICVLSPEDEESLTELSLIKSLSEEDGMIMQGNMVYVMERSPVCLEEIFVALRRCGYNADKFTKDTLRVFLGNVVFKAEKELMKKEIREILRKVRERF